MQLIYNFIEGSCTRHAVLEKIANLTNTKLKTLKSISTTRWACRSEAISAVKENYSSILAAIEEIIDNTKQSDVRAKGKGILHHMKTFEFVFAMLMLDPILSSILKTSVFLQSPNINLLTAVEIVESLKKLLVSMRNTEDDFTDIYHKTIQMCKNYDIEIPQLKKRKVSTKIDCLSSTQHYMSSKEEEMKVSVSILFNIGPYD
ncbi:unnamed protein product [Macrosiphum euphorbiae]|uniref:Uncharacterized protein n=1 Tax=Macrosiphum euphorbiae TaxID=13131 RepID=A0AAV0XRC9_9HEMI|nr:unnamed protein product [Macrosiphum euphorbiae]